MKELCASKEAAAVNEQQYGAELSTVCIIHILMHPVIQRQGLLKSVSHNHWLIIVLVCF